MIYPLIIPPLKLLYSAGCCWGGYLDKASAAGNDSSILSIKLIKGTAMTVRRIYYEDTDAGGVVYYANYLRYLEQGRTEFLRERGVSVRELQEQGYLLPVMRLEIDYLVPAVLDDLIRIKTAVQEITSATCTLGQQVVRVSDGEALAEARVTLACLGPGKKARRLPKALIQALKLDNALPSLDRGLGRKGK